MAIVPDIAETLTSHPSDPSASRCGPARGTAPRLPRVVARASRNLVIDEEMLRYAERRAGDALRSFTGIDAIVILLGGRGAGETTCRLDVTFAGGASVSVGHSGAAILHAIDVAVETTTHILASRFKRPL